MVVTFTRQCMCCAWILLLTSMLFAHITNAEITRHQARAYRRLLREKRDTENSNEVAAASGKPKPKPCSITVTYTRTFSGECTMLAGDIPACKTLRPDPDYLDAFSNQCSTRTSWRSLLENNF